MADYYNGNFADFRYNPYNTLKTYTEMGEGLVSDSSIAKAKEQLAKQKEAPSVFKFSESEGKNTDEYRAGVLSAAEKYIAEGDTDKDGALSFDEYIQLQKTKEQKLKNQTGNCMEEVKIEGENEKDSYRQIFDAINLQRNTDGRQETIDKKEFATYLSYLDANDSDKMDGKINFETSPYIDSELIGETHTGDKEKDKTEGEARNKHIENLKIWYNGLFS